MAFYLYRKGNGNDGAFPRAVYEIPDNLSLGAVLRALVVNDYIPGRSRRRWIARNLEIDSDESHAAAVIYSGPRGETEFGAAWLVASLERLDDDDANYYRDHGPSMDRGNVLGCLDRGARAIAQKG
jgi:hypothetical protein